MQKRIRRYKYKPLFHENADTKVETEAQKSVKEQATGKTEEKGIIKRIAD
ncbi:MAG: hypothetical protein IK038_10280 [Bacteroidaceae bacterium]|nr:hypothetical protein [Bacteroidaceae bacterium]